MEDTILIDCPDFGVHYSESRAARPAKLRELKAYEKLLDSKTPITRLPETGDIYPTVINAGLDAMKTALDVAILAGAEGGMPNFRKIAHKAELKVVEDYLKKQSKAHKKTKPAKRTKPL
jgi:hypothetical protein